MNSTLTPFEREVLDILYTHRNKENYVYLTARIKQEIISKLDSSNASINNAIAKIKKKKVIASIDGYKGEYKFNIV